MKQIITLIISTAIALCFSIHTVAAEYRWVDDTLYVPLRSGKGNQYRILDKGLKSGTRLTVISEDDEWTEVKTSSGELGYVRSQYLKNTPTAGLKLATAEANLSKVTAEYQALKKQLSSAQSSGSQLNQELSEANTRIAELQSELTEIKQVSANAIGLNQRHQELMHEHELMQTEVDILKAENQRLQNDTQNTFFLYGAGAVLLGVILTLIIPTLRRRKRYSEWA
ncbi:TIGR04211 family SH3 domain-containing protein [Aestuariicella hydrocarbonica]|uniref:TIGR04211 family SH3 domain-containing protein n=1 Tax=Pseudomaricurvus hydrocarbonicus TaxID=1470433 RepID=A0A9E5JZN2_9GAMM|nr:TIGR04211 family SH3 domain-containing protein [Aestuariicella hydrocarbonica]